MTLQGSMSLTVRLSFGAWSELFICKNVFFIDRNVLAFQMFSDIYFNDAMVLYR